MHELAQRLRVAERVVGQLVAAGEVSPAVLRLIQRTIKRDCPPLTFGGTSS